jgi:hypothetical protein
LIWRLLLTCPVFDLAIAVPHARGLMPRSDADEKGQTPF